MIMQRPRVGATKEKAGCYFHPTIMYRHVYLGLLTFHAIKCLTPNGQEFDGEINLYCHDIHTATKLGCTVNQNCGYIRDLTKGRMITMCFGFGQEWYKNIQEIATTYSYEASSMPWLTGHFHTTGQINKPGLLC